MYMRITSGSRPFILVSFAGFYLFTASLLRYVSSRDPTSLFFNPRKAYTPAYSAIRRQEANSFIVDSSRITKNATMEPTDPSRHSTLCVGVPSVGRKGAEYLRTSVGSLLEGLTTAERDDMHLIVFIPHLDPTDHPAYSEAWLSNLANDVLVYDLPQDGMKHIAQLEEEGGVFREKGLLDYIHLLRACYIQETPYIAILEDDVVALDGWFHRTIAALREAEILTASKKASVDFLYLRLFYTEEFFGWNHEDWPSYLFWSILLVCTSAAGLIWIRSYSPELKPHLSNRAILGTCGIGLPLAIGLFFAAGRVTVLPLPAGVHEMDKHGCCSQGLVYPRHKVLALIEWYETKKIGFVDVLTEEYADLHGELRLALTPTVLQHIGRKSSKEDDFGPESMYQVRVAGKIWNFAFERNNADELRREHLLAAKTANYMP